MRALVRVLAAALLGGLAVLASSSPAAAHAELSSTEPADGARVAAAPTAVVLTFTEPVSVPERGITVVDATGAPAAVGSPVLEGSTVRVPVDGLGDGSYVVSWRAVSSDSHPIRGAFTFTVGDGPAPDADAVAALLEGPSDAPWEVVGAVTRTLAYLGALVAAGGGLYLALVDAARAPARLYRVVQVAAHVGTFGLLASLPARAALVSGRGAGSLFDRDVARSVFGDGVGLSVTVSLLGLAAVLAGVAIVGAVGRVLLVAGGAAAVAGFAAAGHTTQTDPGWLATGADVAHAAAGAVWLGGLACLAVALGRRRGGGPADAEAGASAVARFSAAAGVAIVVVGVAGAALAWTQVRSLDALVSTTYGRLLLAKVAVVAAVAALGGFNRFRLVPAVRRAGGDAAAWVVLRRTVRIEVAALVVATALTGVLVEVTPARAAVDAGPFRTTAALGDGTVEVVVEDPTVGAARVGLLLRDADGERLDPDGGAVAVQLSLPAAGIGPIQRDAEVVAPGRWQLDGSDLTVAGRWELTIDVRLSRFEQASATVEVPIGAT